MKNNKIRVAIYCRVAREDDEIIKMQEETLRKFAEEHDYDNVSIYSDNGFSGLNFNRPAFILNSVDIRQEKWYTKSKKGNKQDGKCTA